MRIINASSADPAVLHCRVICLDPGSYMPAVGIILTEHGLHKQARTVNTTEKGLYTITYEPIQSCNPSNNIDVMEFRYSFYPLNASVNKTVLTCGVIHPLSQPPCWAQSYAIIHYTEIPITMTPLTTTPLTTMAIMTMPILAITGTSGGGGLFEPSEGNLVRIFSPLTAILALALFIAISITIIEGVIIYHQLSPHNRNDIKPQIGTPNVRNMTPPNEFIRHGNDP